VTEKLIPLDDVLTILDSLAGAPDSYYYVGDPGRIAGWERAIRRVREKIEELVDD
jgi:hypothetical protein